MNVGAAPGAATGAPRGRCLARWNRLRSRRGSGGPGGPGRPGRRIDHQPPCPAGVVHQPHELALRRALPAAGAGAERNVAGQDDTSDNQLIARWRSRARSPMSIPVVVAIASIGVLIRSSGEWMFAVASSR